MRAPQNLGESARGVKPFLAMGWMTQILYRGQRRLWKLLRPRTRGVKVMLFNGAGEILLVRNSYGATHLFVLPGGGVRPWERPADAAEREILEELGHRPEGLRPVSTHLACAEGKRDTVYLFAASFAAAPRPDGREIAEASFFRVDALPTNVSPATARRIAEWTGEAAADGRW
jgi:ADP-ribose pyrophosphatase YjhB (NUDIX family)